ncbi:MAG: hypothetical protein NC930_01810 [Candidatus Omnitrophica bacterium]|nr:hypothetical protein [Candidatus Omnitrophota bacterium]
MKFTFGFMIGIFLFCGSVRTETVGVPSRITEKDVKIHLSTTKPSIGGRRPEIFPHSLRKYEPPPPIVQRKV